MHVMVVTVQSLLKSVYQKRSEDQNSKILKMFVENLRLTKTIEISAVKFCQDANYFHVSNIILAKLNLEASEDISI
jgi:tryptophan synthase alpha subunit